MKPYDTGKPDGFGSSRTFPWVLCFIVLAFLAITVGVGLLPVFAMVKFMGVLGDALESFLSDLFGILGWIVLGFVFAIWLFFDGGSFYEFLMAFLGWLLLDYPPGT